MKKKQQLLIVLPKCCVADRYELSKELMRKNRSWMFGIERVILIRLRKKKR